MAVGLELGKGRIRMQLNAIELINIKEQQRLLVSLTSIYFFLLTDEETSHSLEKS